MYKIQIKDHLLKEKKNKKYLKNLRFYFSIIIMQTYNRVCYCILTINLHFRKIVPITNIVIVDVERRSVFDLRKRKKRKRNTLTCFSMHFPYRTYLNMKFPSGKEEYQEE